MKEDRKEKDIFPTRRLTVHDGDWPGPKVIIQHDMSDFIRKTFGLEEKKQDKPAEVISLKRDPH